MKDKFGIIIGLNAPPLEKQLKRFNIPKNQTDKWEIEIKFIVRLHIFGKITDKQEHKLFDFIVNDIEQYIKELQNER